MPEDAQASGRLVHAAAPFDLDGGEETMTCYSWTLDNEAPIYVQDVTFQNDGSFHHSNWFVVPEDVYPGEDGFWPCSSRDFNDVSAALSGTVLFAQSTQARRETMRFTDGAVIRIPERSKIVGGVHLLNLGPDPQRTAAWFSLGAIHPALVDAVVSPMMLAYRDLDIPANAATRFDSECFTLDLAPVKFHYVLPHYHRAGVSARLWVEYGGAESVVLDHAGFGSQPMGKTFDPPLVVEELDRVGFSCGYDNPHDEPLSWGIGINEMCVFLAFVEAEKILVAGVEDGGWGLPPEGDITVNGGLCDALTVPRGRAYDRPTRGEIEAPLRLPASDAQPIELPECEDVAGTISQTESPTFEDVQERVLLPWCSFSSCHGSGAAAGLDVRGEQAYDALVAAPSTVGDLARVAPGDPEGSSLYRLLSQCEPRLGGSRVRHMPAGAPTLLDPGLVGLVGAWIQDGAPQ